jgi:hypothetical protein
VATAEERLKRYRRELDPAILWPDVSAAQLMAAHQEILEAVRAVLAGRRGILTPRDGPDARAVGIAAFVNVIGPLLGWWIEQGRVEASPALAQLLKEHLSQSREREQIMRPRVASVIKALADRGVTPTVLKGAYTARRYFEDPGARATADIDLLFTRSQSKPVEEALRSLGLVALSFHTLPDRQEWGMKGAEVQSVELTHRENPWGVDVHYSLDREYSKGLVRGLGVPDPSWLEPWEAPGGMVTVLRQPWLGASLALNACADFPYTPLGKLVELIQVLTADLATGRLTWSSLDQVLSRHRVRRFAYPAFALAAQLAPELIDRAFLQTLSEEATARMRTLVADSLDAPWVHFERLSFQARLVWVRGPRQFLLNLFEWIYPHGPAVDGPTRFRIWGRRLSLLFRGRVGVRAGDR